MRVHLFQCSSASRKFLKRDDQREGATDREFQCSSASRKFLNVCFDQQRRRHRHFSALQRAENSSIYEFSTFDDGDERISVLFSEPKIPQIAIETVAEPVNAISVLFSEPKIPQSLVVYARAHYPRISVLFSEPKIPQFGCAGDGDPATKISVLFSEPKIPQSELFRTERSTARHFSALQRAENSSMRSSSSTRLRCGTFQCSSASRKFLKLKRRSSRSVLMNFSALQRAENSSILRYHVPTLRESDFSALQRAENSSSQSRRSTGGT